MLKTELKNPQTTREKILREAFFLVFEQGSQSTSIEQICAKLDLTKGAFFHYFRTKKELMSALITELIQGLGYSRYIEPMLKHDNVIEGLRNVALNMIEINGDYEVRHGCILNNLMSELGRKDEGLHEKLLYLYTSWIAQVEKRIAYGLAKGQIRRDVDAKTAARWFVSSFQGAISLGQSFRDFELFKICLTELADAVSRYLDPPKTVSRYGKIGSKDAQAPR